MDRPGRELSEDQREYLRSALEKVTEGSTELREKLMELGWGEGDFSCLVHPPGHCEFWLPVEGPVPVNCERPGCGHGFFDHAVL
jgi:hypothetical protein